MTSDQLEVIGKNDPGYYAGSMDARKEALGPGALSVKDKLLVAMALDAALIAEVGMRGLVLAAKANGATNEEMMDVIRVVDYICGVGCVHAAARGLQDVL